MKSLKLTIYTLTFLLSFSFVNHAYGATEFVSVVDTGNGSGTDYTSLSAWETGVQTDLTAATTLVFAGTKTGTMADNASVTGASSLATATIVHATSTQILLENISGTFQNGEQIQIDGSNYFTTSNTGDSAIAIAKCRASTGVADTAAVVIDGWTTNATNYIKVWTDPTEGYRHSGRWNDSKYRLNVNANYAIDIENNYVKIDGVQATATGDQVIVVFADPGPVYISNSILKGATYGINQSSGALYLWNSILYDATSDGILISWSSLYIYNVTLKDNGGYGLNRDAGSYTVKVKNVIFDNNVSGDATGINGTDYTVSNCATNVASGSSGLNVAGATGNKYSQLFIFADATNSDFHLSPSDTGAKNAGTNLSADANLSFTNDIDGEIRPEGATWDIGADQYQGAVANSERNLPASLESGLIGYWSFDSPDTTWDPTGISITNDLSGNNYDGTLTNMSQSSSPSSGKVGQAFDFDGVDDYVSAGDINELDGASQLTLSAWIYRINGTNYINIEKSSNTLYAFGINITSQIFFKVANTQNASGYLNFSNKGWSHLVMVFDGTQTGNENRLKGYINNVPQTLSWWGGYDIPATTQVGNSANFLMGRSDAYNLYSKGKIDEVRIYNRALSVDEVGQLYQSGVSKMQPNSVLSKPAGLASGLVGHWSFDGPDTAWTSSTAGTTNDLSGNSNTGTMTNMSRSASPVFGKLGQALKFDGVNDYINLGSASSLDDIQTTGTGMSIGMWVKNNQYTNSQPMLIGKGNANYNGYWHLFLDNNDPSIRFMKDFSGSSDLSVRADYPNTYLGQFKHIVLTWDGSSSASNVHFYIDGLEVSKISSVDGDGSAVSDAALNVSMGLSVIDSTLPFNGLMDDARIYNRALSADEIADLYKTGQMKILK